MEYDQAFAAEQQRHELQRSASGSARPADLNALCAQLEQQIDRARTSAIRIHDHGDRIFGSRPEAVSPAMPPEVAPTLATLIDKMGEQLSRIESGLNRL